MRLGELPQAMSPRSLWDAFILRQVERRVAAYSASAQRRLGELVRAASHRAKLADRLAESHVPSAMVLYREAVLLYMAALLIGSSAELMPGEPLQLADVFSRFRQMLADRSVSIDGERLERFIDVVRGDDPLAIDRLDAGSAFQIVATAQEVVRSLGSLVEPRTVGEIRFERRARLTGLGLALCALGVCGVLLYHESGNIALHKPTTTSGLHPKAVMAPGGLTDGITTGAYGIHTDVSDNPWVQVDLLSVFKIDRVKIYNRGDNAPDAGLPMTLQLSEDGVTFVDIDTRKTSFGQETPWTASGHGKKARYVRVRSVKGKYVALAEIKVFGGKP